MEKKYESLLNESLDVPDLDYVYLTHVSDKTPVKIRASLFFTTHLGREIEDRSFVNDIDSPIELLSGTAKSYEYLVKYLQFYENIPEQPGPVTPIREPITKILEYEVRVFGDLFEYSLENVKLVRDLCFMADYAGTPAFFQKVFALCASQLIKLRLQFDNTSELLDTLTKLISVPPPKISMSSDSECSSFLSAKEFSDASDETL